MNNNKDNQNEPTNKSLPHPPEGMELMDYLQMKEDAKDYIETAMYVYSNLAFKEVDSERKEKLQKEGNRHADLLRSKTWMDVDVARPIAAKYPGLIERLREMNDRNHP
ncbi:hypothetical protein ABZ635_10060 [Nocardiopsis sp. NPDC007018]|uniref:hypothetical protein n=1 Tax=Nocardiopsis sp. NPDC007018 TaxID=3155721 RepID=UPI003402C6E7